MKRFNSRWKVNFSNNCWEFNGSLYSNGYGRISHKNKPRLAHRLSWEIYKGEIPIGLLVLHHCDNRKCVNPEHLFLGTHSDNTRDMYEKKRGGERRGSATNRSKFNEVDIRNIRAIHKYCKNATYVKLAQIYNVTPPAIRYICLGLRWGHIV